MLFSRILRAIRLDGSLYEELRHDPIAVAQALTVLLLAVLSRVIGGVIYNAIEGRDIGTSIGLSLVLMPGIWLLPATSLFVLGGLARAVHEDRGSNRDLIIAAGYSAAPGILWAFLIFIPYVSGLLAWFSFVWLIVSMAFAARSILQVPIYRAVLYVMPGVAMSIMVVLLSGPSGESTGGA